MYGEEVRALRRRTGMSQAVFAEAIGLSRETLGRLERRSEKIDRRTELAIRFFVEKGPTAKKSLQEIHQNIADILDEVAVRGRISRSSESMLRNASGEWTAAGGSEVCLGLIRGAQATVGWLNSMSKSDPSRGHTYAELRKLKLAWRAVANDI